MYASSEPADFQLIETMLYTPGKDRPVEDTLLYPSGPNRTNHKISDMDIALFKQHLLRINKSAIYHKFSFAPRYARRSLLKKIQAFEDECGIQQVLRIRLTLQQTGAMKVECFPFSPAPEDHVISYMMSHKQLDSDDEFLRHKTTKRALFDEEHARLSEEHGCDEVLFLNQREELSEGSRSSLFIIPPQDKSDTKNGQGTAPIMLTPPLSSGLLPGTLREKLIRTKRAKEAVLTMDDLKTAEKVYFGNSVRGLQEATLKQ